MTTFTTTIDSMYTVNTPDPQYVVNVIFTVTGVDGANTASIGGNVQFSSTESSDTFTPYDQLTQSQVLGWIDASGQLPNLEACVQGQINSIITPPVSPVSQPLPWTTA